MAADQTSGVVPLRRVDRVLSQVQQAIDGDDGAPPDDAAAAVLWLGRLAH